MRKVLIVLVMASIYIYSMSSFAASENSLSDFASHLDGLRSTCVNQAKTARSAEAVARYKESLDDELAAHARELNLVNDPESEAEASSAKSKQISDKSASDSQQVNNCVVSAEQNGKTLYSSFRKKNPRYSKDAETLMTAWLANIDEVTFDHPIGSDLTDAAWKTAKAHAELSSL
jgi:hypothetical protein